MTSVTWHTIIEYMIFLDQVYNGMNCHAQIHMKFYHWVPQNVTIFGNTVVAVIMDQDEVILEYGGLLFQFVWTSCKMEIHTKACTWENQHMKLELCCHKSKSNQKLGERLEEISSCAFEGSMALPATWSQTPGLQNCEKIHIFC